MAAFILLYNCRRDGVMTELSSTVATLVSGDDDGSCAPIVATGFTAVILFPQGRSAS